MLNAESYQLGQINKIIAASSGKQTTPLICLSACLRPPAFDQGLVPALSVMLRATPLVSCPRLRPYDLNFPPCFPNILPNHALASFASPLDYAYLLLLPRLALRRAKSSCWGCQDSERRADSRPVGNIAIDRERPNITLLAISGWLAGKEEIFDLIYGIGPAVCLWEESKSNCKCK